MGTADRDYYPPGDLRVSDAERDRALSELSEALQIGRITADEFDERSGQVLSARTGKDLTALLADLPLADRAPAVRATGLERAQRVFATRITIGGAIAATCFTAVAAANALTTGPTYQQRKFMQEFMARQGIKIPLPPAQGFNWPGTLYREQSPCCSW
jgi:Domain of unknown function (DUF1707)